MVKDYPQISDLWFHILEQVALDQIAYSLVWHYETSSFFISPKHFKAILGYGCHLVSGHYQHDSENPSLKFCILWVLIQGEKWWAKNWTLGDILIAAGEVEEFSDGDL